jgi:hypothetical protein
MRRLPLLLAFALAAAVLLAAGCGDDGGTPAENCTNGVDDDADGATDCDDSDCDGEPACAPPAEICTNGIDDDGDGATDCIDTQCLGHPACSPLTEDCANLIDDDGDGATDCADSDCTDDPVCLPTAENCTNGIDDDDDDATDCADSDCTDDPVCLPTAENCTNGIDDDDDGATDCADGDCATHPDCVPPFEDCNNSVDDDRDGLTDCADTADCAGDPACAAICNDSLDRFEDNDDTATATPAADVAPTDALYAVDGDPDFFSFDACRGASVTVTVRFTHALGDIDLELQAADGTRLAFSTTADDDESFTWTGDRRGAVYLRVGMYTPGACNTYRLETAVETSGCILVEPDCSNGIDDDADGLTDCADTADCGALPLCMPETDCRDGIDDDGDTLADCLDPGCLLTPDCTAAGNDTCAAPFVLPDDPVGTWYGDTSTLAADYRGSCAGNGNDAVFRLTLTTGLQLTADTGGSRFDTVLYLRSGDCATGTELDCNDDIGGGVTTSRIVVTLDPGTYYLFVDGYDSRADGPYTLNVALEVVEICDDLLDNDGDGATDCADLDCAIATGCLPATCTEDTHEPNNDRASALPVASITSEEYLAVTPTADDFWSIDVCVGALVLLDARFRDASGDVNLYLQDATGGALTESRGTLDNELIRWVGDRSGTVYLRVDLYGFRPSCSNYRLGVTVDRTACP